MQAEITAESLTVKSVEKHLHDDRTLFQQIACDNECAFEEIFLRFRSGLFSYLLRFTKSTDEAKELTQDIFLKLWINRQSLSTVESPQHYIFTMARNRAIDFLRRAALDSRMRQDLWEVIKENRSTTEEQIFANDKCRLIDEAIYKLSLQKQIVFRLSRVEGLSHDQIAVQLNISKNTVKNHIVAAVKFIKGYVIDR